MVINLLSNAIKFTEEGSIKLSVRRQGPTVWRSETCTTRSAGAEAGQASRVTRSSTTWRRLGSMRSA